ncbi:MAG: pilus assembly protein PilM [Dehalococcoidia bacterium]
MFDSPVVTLNIESNNVKGLVLKGKTIEWWGSVPLEPGVIRDGTVLEQSALSEAVNVLFKGQKMNRDKFIVSLTGLHFTFRILNIPKTKPRELVPNIQRAAQDEMPLPLEEMYLTWQVLGTKGNRHDVFVVGVPRESIDLLIAALAKAKVSPYVLDLKALALARAVNCRNGLLLHLEPDNFGITVVAEGVPSIMRTFIPKKGEMILEDNVRRLSGEVTRTIEFYNREHAENPISEDTPVYLTGEMADSPDASVIIQEEIEYPLKSLLVPFAHDPAFPVASFAVNLGLAMRG